MDPGTLLITLLLIAAAVVIYLVVAGGGMLRSGKDDPGDEAEEGPRPEQTAVEDESPSGRARGFSR